MVVEAKVCMWFECGNFDVSVNVRVSPLIR